MRPGDLVRLVPDRVGSDDDVLLVSIETDVDAVVLCVGDFVLSDDGVVHEFTALVERSDLVLQVFDLLLQDFDDLDEGFTIRGIHVATPMR